MAALDTLNLPEETPAAQGAIQTSIRDPNMSILFMEVASGGSSIKILNED